MAGGRSLPGERSPRAAVPAPVQARSRHWRKQGASAGPVSRSAGAFDREPRLRRPDAPSRPTTLTTRSGADRSLTDTYRPAPRERARAREGPVFRKCCAGASKVDERLDHSIIRDSAEHRHFHRYRHLLGVLFGLMRATANRVLIRRKTSTIAWYSLPSPRRFSPQSARCPKTLEKTRWFTPHS